jgi:hypothetical protein
MEHGVFLGNEAIKKRRLPFSYFKQRQTKTGQVKNCIAPAIFSASNQG